MSSSMINDRGVNPEPIRTRCADFAFEQHSLPTKEWLLKSAQQVRGEEQLQSEIAFVVELQRNEVRVEVAAEECSYEAAIDAVDDVLRQHAVHELLRPASFAREPSSEVAHNR